MVRSCVVVASLVVAWSFVGCTHSGFETRPALVTNSALRFVSGEVVVTLARFEAPGPPCLIEVQGAKSSLDGRAFPCEADGAVLWVRRNGFQRRLLTLVDEGKQGRVPLEDGRVLEVDAAPPPSGEEVGRLVATWRTQEHDGSLAAFQAFSRARYLQESEADLQSVARSVEKTCGFTLAASADWSTVGTAPPGGCDVGCQCKGALEGLGQVCDGAIAPVRRRVAQLVQKVHCRQGSSRGLAYELKQGALEVTFNEPVNIVSNTSEMIRNAGASPAASLVGLGPWHDGKTPDDLNVLDGFKVCRDPGGHLLVLDETRGLFTGSLEALVQSPPIRAGLLSHFAWFADPRMVNRTSPPGFPTELPGRMYARITLDEAQHTCTVTCGAREVKVPLLGQEEGQAVMLASRVVPLPFTRAPHALLRDASGTYYFVDTGTEPGHERDFRLYVGRKGAMVLQKMTNVVADSGGELYSTKSGDLRLLIDAAQASTWSARGKKTPLKTLPLNENLDVVFLELGPYVGQRLGTPCDDF